MAPAERASQTGRRGGAEGNGTKGQRKGAKRGQRRCVCRRKAMGRGQRLITK